jgi:hypothetical protein
MQQMLWQYDDSEADEAIASRRYIKASRILKDAFHQASMTGDFQPQLLQRAEDLARAQSDSGDYYSAAATYRMIVELQRSTLGPEHPDVEKSSLDLIKALMKSGCISPGNA